MLLRIVLIVLALILLAAGALWLLGPREEVDRQITVDGTAIGDDVDAYLARTEADVPNLRSAAEKEVVWAYPASRARTPLALVYVHGFSATKGEIRPLLDEVAERLDANLFYTRLTGHGRDSAAMAQASVNDWLNDLAEAVEIGERLGSRVVVVGMSTGGALAVLGASDPDLASRIDGLVLLSPNFRIQDRYAFLLDLPFARDLLPLLNGPTFGFEPRNEVQAANWTTSYPVVALLPMAALVRAVAKTDLSAISLPVLTIYSPQDRIVDPKATVEAMSHWGGPQELVALERTGDPANHVLAGDILSPETTEPVADIIVDWLRRTFPSPSS